MATRTSTHQSQIFGSIGAACIAFVWLVLRFPASIEHFGRVLDVLGPLQWIVVLAMIVLPALAARRGSKWWLAIAAVGVITFCVCVVAALE